MFDELNEKEMAAANEAMRPIIKELIEAWTKVGNDIMEARQGELKGMFPTRAGKVARLAIMNALSHFIHNCCLSVSPGVQLQLSVTVVCEVLAQALLIDKDHMQAEHAMIQSIASALGAMSDDDTSDDDDRGPAEH